MRHDEHTLTRRSLTTASALSAVALAASLGAGLPATSAAATESESDPGPGGAYELPAELLPYYTQEVTWTSCQDGSAIAQCASIEVPLDYDDPGAGTITVAMKKVPASDGEAEKGSLFTNPGGPGGSGIGTAEYYASNLDSQVRAAYDLIGFDPRGVGQSTPLTCWSQEELDAYLAAVAGGAVNRVGNADTIEQAGPVHDPTDPTDAAGAADAAAGAPTGRPAQTLDAAAMIAHGRSAVADCEKYSEVPQILDHMGTDVVAHDLDVMRALVGDETLSYLGASYGTYLGAEYLEDFPYNAGTMVLDSAMNPAMGRSQIHTDNIAHYEYKLRQFVGGWQATGTSALTGTPDEGMVQLDEWLNSLDAAPLTIDDSPATLDRNDTHNLLKFVSIQHRDYWSAIHDGLGEAMRTGNGTRLAQEALSVSQAITASPAPQATTAVPTREQVIARWNTRYAFYGVHCSDYPDTGTPQDWDARAAATRAAWPISATPEEAYIDAYCHGWGHAQDAEAPAEVSGEGSGDVLVVGNHDDSRTPFPWSKALAGQLANGHLLATSTPIHGALSRNSCARSAINGFLFDGTLPREGTVCPAEPRVPVRKPVNN